MTGLTPAQRNKGWCADGWIVTDNQRPVVDLFEKPRLHDICRRTRCDYGAMVEQNNRVCEARNQIQLMTDEEDRQSIASERVE